MVLDNSRKEDEGHWRECIAAYLDSVPEVYTVRIRADKTWTYILAKRELERMKAEIVLRFGLSSKQSLPSLISARRLLGVLGSRTF